MCGKGSDCDGLGQKRVGIVAVAGFSRHFLSLFTSGLLLPEWEHSCREAGAVAVCIVFCFLDGKSCVRTV